ncbi:hypothetical protein MYX82_14190 [Acidobacteria bacterium AH-259-D05]|nr:hypothetical protein [Acidobacteria bacterium AH-259-D05]
MKKYFSHQSVGPSVAPEKAIRLVIVNNQNDFTPQLVRGLKWKLEDAGFVVLLSTSLEDSFLEVSPPVPFSGDRRR